MAAWPAAVAASRERFLSASVPGCDEIWQWEVIVNMSLTSLFLAFNFRNDRLYLGEL